MPRAAGHTISKRLHSEGSFIQGNGPGMKGSETCVPHCCRVDSTWCQLDRASCIDMRVTMPDRIQLERIHRPVPRENRTTGKTFMRVARSWGWNSKGVWVETAETSLMVYAAVKPNFAIVGTVASSIKRSGVCFRIKRRWPNFLIVKVTCCTKIL